MLPLWSFYTLVLLGLSLSLAPLTGAGAHYQPRRDQPAQYNQPPSLAKTPSNEPSPNAPSRDQTPPPKSWPSSQETAKYHSNEPSPSKEASSHAWRWHRHLYEYKKPAASSSRHPFQHHYGYWPADSPKPPPTAWPHNTRNMTSDKWHHSYWPNPWYRHGSPPPPPLTKAWPPVPSFKWPARASPPCEEDAGKHAAAPKPPHRWPRRFSPHF